MPTSICGIEGPLVPQTNHLCSPPFMQDMDIQNYASSIHISNQMKQTDPLGSRNFELTFHSSLSSSREKLQPKQKCNSFGLIMGKKTILSVLMWFFSDLYVSIFVCNET